MKKVHYLGGIEYRNGWRLRGWVCCCTGEKCRDLTLNGLTTYDKEDVTCKSCLGMIKKQNEWFEKIGKDVKKTIKIKRLDGTYL